MPPVRSKSMSDTFTVAELCQAVRTVIEDTFPDEVWVKGAISGLTRSTNGHVYFDLIDVSSDLGAATEAVVPVALFSANKRHVNAILRRTGNIRMTDGVEIRIRGRIAYYPPQGRIQLVMSLIDPAYTVGQMAIARQLLLDQLGADGLLNANGKLPFPVLPLRVGLVTSDASAAHADFDHELRGSGYRFDITMFDCRVQGIDAVPSLVDGIERAGRDSCDVVVVIRGGGARTDLAAFDHERVARAIASCPKPVIVGVGHEVDRSVADEVASVSAKTPTAAASTLLDAVEDFEDSVEHAASRLLTLATNRLEAATHNLRASSSRLELAATTATSTHSANINARAAQLGHGGTRATERASATLEQVELRLRALDPARVLARGWSITHAADGRLVRHPDDAPPGTRLVTTTAGGRLLSTAEPDRLDPDPSDGGAKTTRSGDTVAND